MDQTLSLGWMQAEARKRRSAFHRLLRITLVIEVLLGLAALLAPGWFTALLGMPPIAQIAAVTGWTRAWGALLVVMAAFQIPSLLDPVRHRWGNVVGIAARLLLAVVVYLPLGHGFLWLFLLEGGLGAVLAILYFNLFRAELMSRP